MARSFPFFDILFLLFLTLYILNKYGNWRRQRLAVTLATLISWYFSFIIIGILPLDVSMTTYYQCLANSNMSVVNLTTIIPSPNSSTQNYTYLTPISYSLTDIDKDTVAPFKHSKKRILYVKRDVYIKNSSYLPYQSQYTQMELANTTLGNISTSTTISHIPSLHANFMNITTTTPKPINGTDNEPPRIICKKPWNYIPRSVLPSLWRIVYWTSQVLTWLILPLMQTYSKAGDFTVIGKIRTAIYENLLWYGSYVLIFIVLMVYVAFKPNLHFDMSKILTICSTASNTWGLTLLVILLGYGLIEVPRALWRYSFMSGRVKLDRCFYKAALLFPKKAEAEENLEEVLEDVKQLAATVPTHHASRHKVDILIDKIPASYRSKMNLVSASEAADEGSRLHRALDIPPNLKAMVKLNKRLIATLTAHYRTQMQWQALMDSIVRLEKDLRHISSRSKPDSTPQNGGPADGTASGPGATGDSRDLAYLIQALGNNQYPENDLAEISHKPGGGGARCQMAAHLARRRLRIMGIYFRRYLRPWTYRLIALVFACFSLAVIWSELVLFKRDPALSLFAIFFDLAKRHQHNYIYIQVVSILTITYLSVCAYFPIFKLRLFDFYALIPHHHTDENSLLFSGLLLSRLTSPLCLNFLCLIHMDRYVSPKSTQTAATATNSRIYETTFIQIMGRMEFLPIIAHGFNVYFPMAIFLLCLANYFDLVRKALRAVGYSRATASDFNEYYVNNKTTGASASDGHAQVLALVEEGKQLVRRELRNRILKSRETNSDSFRQSRYSGVSLRTADSGSDPKNNFNERRPITESMTDARLNTHSSREDLLPKHNRSFPSTGGSDPTTRFVSKYKAIASDAINRVANVANYKTIKSSVGPGLSSFYKNITNKPAPPTPTFGPRGGFVPKPDPYGRDRLDGEGTPYQPPKNIFDDI